MIYGKAEDIADKYIVGYKEEKERKKAEKARGRPPTWDETVRNQRGRMEVVGGFFSLFWGGGLGERVCVCRCVVFGRLPT
jgi:hypothetical protein